MADFIFDKEAYRQYIDDVNKSQGFYLTSDYGYNLLGGIVKINENDIVRYQRAERAALFAVEQYNKKEKANLNYLRILNLNMEPVAGAMYYITLAAMEASGDVNHYQAKVWEKVHTGFHVQIFRLAPYATRHIETLKEDRGCVWIGNLQPEMDENYLYHSCFHRVNELVSAKVIRDEQTGKSEGYGFLWFKTQSSAEEVLNAYNGTMMPNASQCFNLDRAKLKKM